MKQSGFSLAWRMATESRLFLPLVALALILLFDLITIPGFFSIQTRDGNLYLSLIHISEPTRPY